MVFRLNNFFKVFHTVRYLKLSQIYFRIIRKFCQPVHHVVVAQCQAVTGKWVVVYLYNQKLFKNSEVKFLNEKGSIKTPDGWNDESKDKLWLYNLHYFDDLCAVGTQKRVERQTDLVERWVRENPAPIGNGWEPYPSSLRMVNWIKFFISGNTPSQVVLDSSAQQADFLLQNLERHILGNHLFSNAKALIFAGLYLDSADANKWLKDGLKIYKYELDEQVLADGGNFELSPMYHSIMLVDLLDLINVFAAYPNKVESVLVENTKKAVSKMLNWLQVMTHHDGEISFFNDAAIGVAVKPSRIYAYAKELGFDAPMASKDRLVLLEQSGYSRINMLSHSLYFDHARVGPDYLPGHAHADSLSVEWSVDCCRVLVNSGTSMYGLSDERLLQRGTAAHNTVVVDGEDSSEVWSGFRVARRAYTTLLEHSKTDVGVIISASHDGYCRLKGNVTHTRTVLAEEFSLKIIDELSGQWHTAETMFHLHPNIKVEALTKCSVRLSLPSKQAILIESSGEIVLSDGFWYPEFGLSVANKKLAISFDQANLRTSFFFEG